MFILIGRWSEESAVIVFHVARLVYVLCVSVMSGEDGCWFVAVGSLVGVFVLRML